MILAFPYARVRPPPPWRAKRLGRPRPCFECGDCIAGNLRVRALVNIRKAHFDVVGDAHDTMDPLRRFLFLGFSIVVVNESGQRHHPILHRYGNVSRVDIRVFLKLNLNVTLDFAIASHVSSVADGAGGCVRAYRLRPSRIVDVGTTGLLRP